MRRILFGLAAIMLFVGSAQAAFTPFRDDDGDGYYGLPVRPWLAAFVMQHWAQIEAHPELYTWILGRGELSDLPFHVFGGGVDCDDADPFRNPGYEESCDGQDNDCNPMTTDTSDADGDGFSACAGDCSQYELDVHPGAPEYCDDGLDSDCDGDPENAGDCEPSP